MYTLTSNKFFFPSGKITYCVNPTVTDLALVTKQQKYNHYKSTRA